MARPPIHRALSVIVILIGLTCLFAYYRPWGNHPTNGARITFDKNRSSIVSMLNRLDLTEFEAPPPSQRTEHILLITLDTLRADHLSCYGYPRETSPFLDSIAAAGVRFNRAIAPMATTVPSHATLLTGLYPIQHGVLKNGARLNDGVQTLPEILSAAGFRTAGIVSTNYHFAAANIDQGFHYFNEPAPEELFSGPKGPKQILQFKYRAAEQTLRKALEWLERTPRSERLFLWIHLFDAHKPYAHRQAHLDAFISGDPQEAQEWSKFIRQEHYFERANDHRTWLEHYDAEIRYLDSSLRAFFSQAKQLAFDDVLTIIVADHGEGLGTHDWWGHGKHIYNEQIRVPLLLQWPSRAFAGTTIETIVELNDIMPTILKAAGINRETIARNRRLPIEGTPLQHLLEGGGDPDEFGYAFVQRRAFDLLGEREPYYESGEKYALLNSEGKYVYRTTASDEFYHLDGDFYEQRNLIESESSAKVHLASSLYDLISHLQSAAVFDEELVDEETIRALKSLGYVQ